MLLYADDIRVLASSASELQAKLHDLQQCLSVIGLHINTSKCSVLHDGKGACPGVWPLRDCRPLAGSDDISYLGVPLSHRQTPLGQRGLSLAKVSTSFFGLRIFDHPSTAVGTKLELFRSYVTAKWAWCAPASWPSCRSLKSIDAFKHTLLLSLLRIDVDPLLPYLTNTISRRRAVRYICYEHGSNSWGELWLTRLWNFWGHAFRSGNALPLQAILQTCNSHVVGRSRVPKSFVIDFVPRKLQKFWCRVRSNSPYPFIGVLAQDRVAWAAAPHCLNLKP